MTVKYRGWILHGRARKREKEGGEEEKEGGPAAIISSGRLTNDYASATFAQN